MFIYAAADSGRGIGISGSGSLPWGHISADRKRFREFTEGKTLICGRTAAETVLGGRAPAGSRCIVLTSGKQFPEETGFETAGGLAQLLAGLGNTPDGNIAVIGGGKVFGEMLPFCDTVFMTEIDGSTGADVFFPELREKEWVRRKTGAWQTENGVKFRFSEFARREHGKKREYRSE